VLVGQGNRCLRTPLGGRDNHREVAIATSRQAEADKASIAFHLALTQIGAQTIEEALALWNEVPPTARPETAGRWLKAAIHLVMTRRARSRDLAVAYYRLVRALHTGTTIPRPGEPVPRSVSLAQLRREFAELTVPSGARASAAPSADTPEPPGGAQAGAQDADEAPEDDEDDRILVEELARLQEEADRLEVEAEEEARIALEALGPANLAKLNDEIDDERPASEVDGLRDEAHTRAGARQAAAAARVVMDGARGTIWSQAQRDKRVIGYVRLSRTGTPCGWCAMLISRGPVYRSEGSAEYSDGDKYHDNCHCFAMPVYSRDQYKSSDLFELNRKYAELWPVITRGLSGKAAVSAWRRFIRAEQKTRDQASR
jgi:hypothetical protein